MSEEQIRTLIQEEVAAALCRMESARRTRWTLLAKAWRQSVLMLLGALEEHEELQRSVTPRHIDRARGR